MFRKFAPAAVVFVVVMSALLVAIPTQAVYACLPCYCPHNRSLNCYGDYAVYTKMSKDGSSCYIQVLGVDRKGKPRLAITATADELAKLPDKPDQNTLIDQYYEFALYKLTSGEYQLNVGPDSEGKVFVIDFTGCPADHVYESTFIAKSQ